jgi:hypothetical protein
VFPPWCFHQAARSQVGSPGLYPLRHLRIRKSTSPKPTKPRTFRLQGLVTLLAASSARTLWTIFQIQAPMGFSPSEFFSLPRSRISLEIFLLSCRLLVLDPKIQFQLRLQSFAPPGRAAFTASVVNVCRNRYSLGVSISGVLSPTSLLPLRVNSSFVLYRVPGAPITPLYPRVFLMPARMSLRETSDPSDVLCLVHPLNRS